VSNVAVIFELSRNGRLLEQYYRLREERFREDLGIPAFDGSEELQDRRGDVLVAHKNGQCVGGIRITSSDLSPNLLQGLEYPAAGCCVWERFVLAPEVRSVKFARQFCDNLITMSQALGYRYALVLSSRRTARFYRQLHSGLGVSFRILRPAPDYASGAFSGLEHYLSVSHLEDSPPLAMVA
jgi:hypothetical protein